MVYAWLSHILGIIELVVIFLVTNIICMYNDVIVIAIHAIRTEVIVLLSTLVIPLWLYLSGYTTIVYSVGRQILVTTKRG